MVMNSEIAASLADNYNFTARDYLEEPVEIFNYPTTDRQIIVGIIFLVSLAMNIILLIQQIYAYRLERIYNNKFTLIIINLAVSNILVTLFCMLKGLVWLITYHWFASDSACKLLMFLRMFSIYLNSFSVTAVLMSAVVAKKIRKLDHWFMVLIFVCPAWMFSALLSIPEAVMFGTSKVEGSKHLQQCHIKEKLHNVAYFYHELFMVPFGLLFPFILFCMLTYVLLCYKEQKKAPTSSTTTVTNTYELMNSELDNDMNTEDVIFASPIEAKDKPHYLPVIVAAIYFGCWMPYLIGSILNMFIRDDLDLLYFWAYYVGTGSTLFTASIIVIDSFIGFC